MLFCGAIDPVSNGPMNNTDRQKLLLQPAPVCLSQTLVKLSLASGQSWRSDRGGRLWFFNTTCVGERVEGNPVHQQWCEKREVFPGAGQHGQPPGIDVAPIGGRPIFQPCCVEPGQVQARPKYRDRTGDPGQLVKAAFVFNQYQPFAR